MRMTDSEKLRYIEEVLESALRDVKDVCWAPNYEFIHVVFQARATILNLGAQAKAFRALNDKFVEEYNLLHGISIDSE
jgi:hypothetical protein